MKENLIEKVNEIVESLKKSDQTIEVRGALISAQKFKDSLSILDNKYLNIELEEDKEPVVEKELVKEVVIKEKK